jgi:hypothetical protein
MEANRATFQTLLASLTDADLARPSGNPAFSVKEVLHHMVQSLQAVPAEVHAAQRGRNLFAMPQWLYDAGLAVWSARLTAWPQTRASLARNYGAVHAAALKALDAVQETEWARPLQMFYVKTTLEDVFRRQARHLAEHGEQVRAA